MFQIPGNNLILAKHLKLTLFIFPLKIGKGFEVTENVKILRFEGDSDNS